jgi:DNA-binding MarR family transcriptional regulator
MGAMADTADRDADAPTPAATVAADDLRGALHDLLASERRLRSRDPQRPGALSYTQVRALVMLHDEDATAGQLARAAGLTPASVTAMLDHLEQEGMIARRRSTEDRRLVVVSLTARGRELLAEKQARWRARWEEAFADLAPEQLAGAADVMRRMAAMFDGI